MPEVHGLHLLPDDRIVPLILLHLLDGTQETLTNPSDLVEVLRPRVHHEADGVHPTSKDTLVPHGLRATGETLTHLQMLLDVLAEVVDRLLGDRDVTPLHRSDRSLMLLDVDTVIVRLLGNRLLPRLEELGVLQLSEATLSLDQFGVHSHLRRVTHLDAHTVGDEAIHDGLAPRPEEVSLLGPVVEELRLSRCELGAEDRRAKALLWLHEGSGSPKHHLAAEGAGNETEHIDRNGVRHTGANGSPDLVLYISEVPREPSRVAESGIENVLGVTTPTTDLILPESNGLTLLHTLFSTLSSFGHDQLQVLMSFGFS